MERVALLVFLATYVLLLLLPKVRAQIALLGGLVFVALGYISIFEVVQLVDWNVILMIAGTMGIVSLFIDSRMPALLADLILERVPNLRWALVALALLAGLISAFIDNVATVLMIAPIAISVSQKQKISPVTGVIAVAISSNLQGAATLVGDATSILLGGYAGLDFLDFFFLKGRPGLFWVVQAGALTATAVLYGVLRNNRRKVLPQKRTIVRDYFPSLLLLSLIFLLIAASFVPQKPRLTNGLICLALLAVGLGREFWRSGDVGDLRRTLGAIDLFTLLLLSGLFVVIGGVSKAGVIEGLSAFVVRAGRGSIFLVYTLSVWLSVFVSGFVDNIPYVAAMLPVAQKTAALLQVEPHFLYFGLLIGATLGGNLTPIGASANITALGLLRREGFSVKTGEFVGLSIPFTLAAVLTGYILLWLIWGGTV